MNFVDETKEAIKESEHLIEDIMFIGSKDGKYRITWNDFIKIGDFDYDNGYGWSEIPDNLIVYFKDGTYLFRNEYDGSEWWECIVNKPIKENEYYSPFNNIKDLNIIYSNEGNYKIGVRDGILKSENLIHNEMNKFKNTNEKEKQLLKNYCQQIFEKLDSYLKNIKEENS